MSEIHSCFLRLCLVYAKYISILIVIVKGHDHIHIIVALGTSYANLFIFNVKNIVMLTHQCTSKEYLIVMGLIGCQAVLSAIFFEI